ncbi:MAG: TrkA C-terminal domain-containing protein [Desulfotomaculum sp.]|nr:TrkA C-terminal domain-containing protein [Desulfotomaculum sp.]
MNIIFLTVFLILLISIVEVAAIALKITGMDYSKARFQALSALLTCGFTTSEAELITQHPARRKLVMILMTIGYLGMATIVTSLLNVVRHHVTLIQASIVSFLAVTAVGFYTNRALMGKLGYAIEKRLAERKFLKRKSIEELLHLGKDYTVAEVLLESECPLLNRTVAENKLRDYGIFILTIERGNETIYSPRGSEKLLVGDKLLVYGQKAAINSLCRHDEMTCG